MQKVKEIPQCFEILKNKPKDLYYEGNLSLMNMPMVAIVGTRHPISYTKQLCLNLGNALKKRGVCVVSGAAMGVDALAHRSAFPNTIAVMANSLDICYPKVNFSLIEDMRRESLLLSEYEENTKATNYSFVLRNRLVVALGEVLVVAEADLDSGSMRSAEIAHQLGKKIFVFPHRSGESLGTNMLLSKGMATAIYDIDDFADKFGKIIETSDKFLDFCKENENIQDILEKFGDMVYEYELAGKIEIHDMKVLVL
ncbi:MAG: DNA-processing protein DprA [Sulfurospirillaceae bacterium]|nr:DNA-processing protein DprA [Sulfurospirillaceae bacterium]